MTRLRTRPGSTLASYILLTVASSLSVALNTDLSSPPRFDGAGYAVLGEALVSGRGYREIDVPGTPRHAHFPPGYPAALALLWRLVGRSAPAAHVFSAACTVAAVLLAWRWFRRLYPPRTALILGLAMALNWTWARNGGAIQSEPLYLAWELFAVLAASRASRGGLGAGVILGFVLAACVLTRHVGVCLVAAAAIDLGMRGRRRELSAALLTAMALVFPWVVWLALVRHNTQVSMLTLEDLPARFAAQSWFYLQRLPDQIVGPFVEVATVFQRSPAIALVGNVWAVAATAVVIWGWVRTLRTPRRRLAGLIALTTLALLSAWPFTEAGRLLMPLLPFLLVGAIEGIAALLALRAPRRARRWAALILLTVSVPYNAYSILSGRAGAQRGTHAGFDAACLWIAEHATRPGPVLFRHPGEVFWQTGRQAIAPDSPDPDAIARLIDRFGIAYLLIDDDRYARASPSPLGRYVERFPDHVVLVWQANPGPAQVRVYEVLRRHGIALGRGAN
jgi:hypothetical protein